MARDQAAQGVALTRRFSVESEGRLFWWVQGPHGVANLLAMLIPNLPGMEEHAQALNWVPSDGGWLFGADVGYHHADPPSDPQYWMHNETCFLLDGQECWYDGSALAAEPILTAWYEAAFDDEVIYRYLEQRYHEEFLGEHHDD